MSLRDLEFEHAARESAEDVALQYLDTLGGRGLSGHEVNRLVNLVIDAYQVARSTP